MMFRLLDSDVQQFLRDHENADERKLVLSGQLPVGVTAADIGRQLVGRRKARTKLPLWYHAVGALYPPLVNLEQSSSELPARFKAFLARELIPERKRGVDLTQGFGVDSHFLAQQFSEWHSVEPDKSLLDIAAHNHRLLAVSTIHYHPLSAVDFINDQHQPFDFIYIDPSRRKGSQRSVQLADHEPNVVALQPRIWSLTKHLLIKASPMLDLSQMMREIRHLTHLVVVGVDNEVKELLGWAKKDFEGRPSIVAINFSGNDPLANGWANRFSFTPDEEMAAQSTFGPLKPYVYEPWAPLLKAGPFKLLGQRFGLTKLDVNTHFYTSAERQTHFPGRIFEVVTSLKLDKHVSAQFEGQQANIISRNHPLSVAEICRKTQLTEGGTEYVLAFRAEGKPMAVKAIRIQ